jgi:hypothetical protein
MAAVAALARHRDAGLGVASLFRVLLFGSSIRP